MNVAVLAGGRSAERGVSLRSGAQVVSALRDRGHQVEHVDLDEHTWEALRDGRFDCAFIALHGRLGEDGTVQGMLEVLGLPYTGSGVQASALCIDKSRTNALVAAAGLRVPAFEEVRIEASEAAGTLVGRLVAQLGLPVVVKPVREGSTIGLTVAADEDALASGLREAARHDPRVMVQRFKAGTEVTVGVLMTPEVLVLPVLEIVSENPVYDFDAKYTTGKSRHIIPARISSTARDVTAQSALTAVTTMGCEGMARVDFIVDDAGTPWFLEVNTVPGLTEVSLLPDAARAAGIEFADLCERLVQHAVVRGARTPVG